MTHEDHAKALELNAKWVRAQCAIPTEPERLAQACEAGALALRQQGQTCRWVEDDSEEYWRTGCGHTFAFTTDGPTENEQRFCGYCGGRLIEVPCESQFDDEDED